MTKVEVPNVSSWLEIGLAGCFFPLAARFTLDSHIFQHSIESLFNSGCRVQVDKFQMCTQLTLLFRWTQVQKKGPLQTPLPLNFFLFPISENVEK